jgi:3-deoxy-D-manno-octulosonic-acid transferase
MRSLYSIAIHIYSLGIFVFSLFNEKARKLRNGHRHAFEKLKKEVDPNARYVWFHAASLGEFEQGRPVIEHLKREQPDAKILLTFFSPSGYEIRKNFAGVDLVSYLPLDTPANARKFIKLINPSKAIFIKYEFWPNYLLALHKAKVPTYIISAIFRPDQLFFKPYGKWYLDLLKAFSHIFVQDENSLKLLTSHSIENASICGDTRFDRVFDLHQQAKQFSLIEEFIQDKKVIVAGSTWPKDESLLIRYHNEHPDVKLILVPHEIHKTHLYDIFKLLQGDFVRYTEATSVNVLTSNCLIVDTIGMLSSIYRYANVAYIGGGFGEGIHNTLEAAVYGVPVIFGPNYQKFREARELISEGGAFSIHNYDELEKTLDNLLNNTGSGEIAGAYVKNNTGATGLIIKEINL